MLVRIYKTGYIFHAISIIIFAILIWLPSILSQPDLVVESSIPPLYILYFFIIGTGSFVNLIISLLLVIVSGLIINQIIIANEISGKTTMLGMFFFVLLNISMVSNVVMNPFLWVSFFLLLMLKELFKLPKTETTIPIIFNASIYLGLASLFYYPSLVIILVIWVSLMTFRINNWREYVIVPIGVLLPLFFTFTWYYYNDNQELFFSTIRSSFYFDFTILRLAVFDLVIVILLMGLIIPSVVKLAGSMMDKSIVLRQKLAVTIWLYVVSFIIILLFEKHTNTGLLLSIPTTIILTKYSLGIKRLKWLDLYISLIFILIVVNHYKVLFDA